MYHLAACFHTVLIDHNVIALPVSRRSLLLYNLFCRIPGIVVYDDRLFHVVLLIDLSFCYPKLQIRHRNDEFLTVPYHRIRAVQPV